MLALVASCVFVTAVRACSSDVAVCKEAFAFRTEKLLNGVFLYEAAVIKGFEKALYDFCLLRRRCASEIVEVDAEPVVYILVDCVIVIAEFTWFLVLFKSFCLGSGSVFIGSADIQCVISAAAAETCENVG